MSTNFLVKNDLGQKFEVRIIEKGQLYDHENYIINNKDEPIVEFYSISKHNRKILINRFFSDVITRTKDVINFGGYSLAHENLREVKDFLRNISTRQRNIELLNNHLASLFPNITSKKEDGEGDGYFVDIENVPNTNGIIENDGKNFNLKIHTSNINVVEAILHSLQDILSPRVFNITVSGILDGQLIPSIKWLRELTGYTLVDAKNVVDKLRQSPLTTFELPGNYTKEQIERTKPFLKTSFASVEITNVRHGKQNKSMC